MPATDYPTLELPIAHGYAWETLHAQWVDGDPYQPEALTPRYYEVKAQVAAWCRPQRVVEIGVRAGYSALALYMGFPYTRFVGFDLDEGTMGGVRGYFVEATARLSRLRDCQVSLHRVDSQTLRSLPVVARHADLFHVDGDHTPAGCAHDILLALTAKARWILVDDYDYTEHVRDAADFVVTHRRLNAWYIPDGGYRGNLLIQGDQ